MQGYVAEGRGRCHYGVEVIEQGPVTSKVCRHYDNYPYNVASQDLTILPEGQRFLSVLWAGGWDEYVVDLNDVRDLTPVEIEEAAKCRERGGGLSPEIYSAVKGKYHAIYIRGVFAKGLLPETQCVRVVRHLAGGD